LWASKNAGFLLIFAKTRQFSLIMQKPSTSTAQLGFDFDSKLERLVNPKHPLVQLAHTIPWQEFETGFASHYSDIGRPAHTIRLMVSLQILKYLEDLSDEVLLERWKENPYYQYF
jgi:IS5 family transposase